MGKGEERKKERETEKVEDRRKEEREEERKEGRKEERSNEKRKKKMKEEIEENQEIVILTGRGDVSFRGEIYFINTKGHQIFQYEQTQNLPLKLLCCV